MNKKGRQRLKSLTRRVRFLESAVSVLAAASQVVPEDDVSPRAVSWEQWRTDESRHVEEVLRTQFPQTDAYQFNSASIRIRVIDERFAHLSYGERADLLEAVLDTFPYEKAGGLLPLYLFTESEVCVSDPHRQANHDFMFPTWLSL